MQVSTALEGGKVQVFGVLKCSEVFNDDMAELLIGFWVAGPRVNSQLSIDAVVSRPARRM